MNYIRDIDVYVTPGRAGGTTFAAVNHFYEEIIVFDIGGHSCLCLRVRTGEYRLLNYCGQDQRISTAIGQTPEYGSQENE